jgi:Xaa-Pro aminopeptidase
MLDVDHAVPSASEREKSVRRRREGLMTVMSKARLDWIVIGSQANFFFVTGYHTPTWQFPLRPLFLLLGADGAAQAIVSKAEAEQVCAGGVDLTAAPYVDPLPVEQDGLIELQHVEAAQQVVIRELRARGAKRVGLELAAAPPSHMTPRFAEAIVREVEIVDVSMQLSSLRRIKDTVDLAGLRIAGAALGRAFDGFEAGARVGMTERELRNVLLSAAGAAGADFVSYIALRHTDGDMLGPATYRRWEPGEVIYVDCALCVDGYWADLSRHYVATDLSTAQDKAYTTLIDVLRREKEAVRAGVRCSDVAEIVRSTLGAGRYGRFGHGIGLQFLEPPSLASADPTRLVAGMTLCVEPIGTFPGAGELIAEEMVVVAENGCELLSPPMPTKMEVLQ